MNTIRNNSHIAKAWEHNQLTDWERARYISFTVYKSVYTMDGKAIFKNIRKPDQLFKLRTDYKNIKIEYDYERAKRAVDSFKKRLDKK